MISSPVSSKDRVFFSNSKVFITDVDENNIHEIVRIIPDNKYIGATSDVVLSIDKEVKHEYTFVNGVRVLRNSEPIAVNAELSFNALEVTDANLQMFIDITNMSFKRIEIFSNYPDKKNHVMGIFPKVQLISNVHLSMTSGESPVVLPMKFSLLHPEVSEWGVKLFGSVMSYTGSL